MTLEKLSYSDFHVYLECQRQYWHQCWNRTKPQVPDNRVNAMYGSLVGQLFEQFYKMQMWRTPGVAAHLCSLADIYYDKIMTDDLARGHTYDYSAPGVTFKSPESLLRATKEAVVRGIQSIKCWRLLGPEVETEVKLDVKLQGHELRGRADFIIKRLDGDVIIIDGKGSQHRDRFVDRKQLLWYALLHRYKRGFFPNKLGFLYWRCEPSEAVGWIDFTEGDLRDLRGHILSVIAAIEDKSKEVDGTDFRASPELSRCRLCAFRPGCSEGLTCGV